MEQNKQAGTDKGSSEFVCGLTFDEQEDPFVDTAGQTPLVSSADHLFVNTFLDLYFGILLEETFYMYQPCLAY